jgi:hypothetical protein
MGRKKAFTMKKEEEKKTGWLSLIRESMTKTGGCCGSGETCCGSADKIEKKNVKVREADGSKGTERN